MSWVVDEDVAAHRTRPIVVVFKLNSNPYTDTDFVGNMVACADADYGRAWDVGEVDDRVGVGAGAGWVSGFADVALGIVGEEMVVGKMLSGEAGGLVREC